MYSFSVLSSFLSEVVMYSDRSYVIPKFFRFNLLGYSPLGLLDSANSGCALVNFGLNFWKNENLFLSQVRSVVFVLSQKLDPRENLSLGSC